MSTHNIVMDCVKALAAPSTRPYINDSTKLKDVPAAGKDLAQCINDGVQLKGDQRWRPNQIKPELSVGVLASRTENRRKWKP